METNKSVQISFVILMVMMSIALIYSFATTFKPDLMASLSFMLYTDQSWNDFLKETPRLANYILIIERMAGGLGIAASAGGLIILLTVYRKAEKWTWYYVLFVGIIAWTNNLIANIMLKNLSVVIIIAIGLTLMIIGLIIPARVFLGKNKN